MTQETINHYNPKDEFYTSENCYITELWNSKSDNVSIARARVRPSETTKWHRLAGITERYVIIQGCGSVEVGNLPVGIVTVGDVVVIPPMSAQRISNSGTEDLIFLAICSPRFEAAAYQEIEDDLNKD